MSASGFRMIGMTTALSVTLLAVFLVQEASGFLGGTTRVFTGNAHPTIRWTAAANDESSSSSSEEPEKRVPKKPIILEPFLPAADPNYMNVGPVGEDGKFLVTRSGEPLIDELSNENLLKIVRTECSDLEANTLLWKCLGYRYNISEKQWTNEACFPNWKGKYPTPPDFIGMRRIYAPEVDKPSLRANQAIVRSVPVEHKQSLKTFLRPLGFTGFQYSELTPNLTRRAQCANWLLYYREELFGYTIEELRERRQLKREAGELAKKEDEWKPPVKEVF